MIRLIFLCALFVCTTVQAKGTATITLDIRTSYPTTIEIEEEIYGQILTHKIGKFEVAKDTVIQLELDADFKRHTIDDVSHLITHWFYPVAGDSLVFQLDLNKATASITHDRQGYYLTYREHLDELGAQVRSLDSMSRALPWSTYSKFVDGAAKRFAFESKNRSTRLASSGYAKLVADGLAVFPLMRKFEYLKRVSWDASTLEELSSSTPFVKELSDPKIASNAHVSTIVANWLQLIEKREMQLGRMRTADSTLIAHIKLLKAGARDAAMIYYSQREAQRATTIAHWDRLDSLTSNIGFTEALAKQAYANFVANRRRLFPGQVAPDFELPGPDGVLRKLSDLRGKIVLIDFWGTWCGPCINEIPHLNELAKAYEGKDLVILGVALEGRKVTKWQKFIKDRGLDWQHMYAEGQFDADVVHDFGIAAVPRYALLDREGRFIAPHAPRPSNKALRQMIDEALAR